MPTIDYTTVVVTTLDTYNTVSSTDQNNMQVVLSNGANYYATIVGPALHIGTDIGAKNIAGINLIAMSVTLSKVNRDYEEGVGIASGDIINIIASGVTAAAALAFISAGVVTSPLTLSLFGLFAAGRTKRGQYRNYFLN